MNSKRQMSAMPRAILAVVGLFALAGDSLAENLLVRNESRIPVVVQAAGVVKGALQRGRPVLLNAKDVSPAIQLPGNKILSVYDAKAPNRLLFQGAIPASMMDQHFGIVADPTTGRMRVEKRRPFTTP